MKVDKLTFVKEKIKKIRVKVLIFLALFFITVIIGYPSFTSAQDKPPTCSLSIEPSEIQQGDAAWDSWEIVGDYNKVTINCSGVLGYQGGSWEEEEIKHGGKITGMVQPKSVGAGSCKWTVCGPSGCSDCSNFINVLPKPTTEELAKLLTFELIGNENLRNCPSLSCSIIQAGTYDGLAKLLEKSGDWYKVEVTERGKWYEYGVQRAPKSMWITKEGWFHGSLIPENVKQAFIASQQKEQIAQTEEDQTPKEKPQNKFTLLLSLFQNKNFQASLIITFVFIVFLLSILLLRKKIKAIFWLKWSSVNLQKIKFNQKIFAISILIAIGIVIGIGGVSYGVAYYQTSKSIEEAEQLTKEEKYEEAIGKLNLAQVSWFVKNLGIKKQEISDKQEENKKLIEELSKYNQGLDKFDKGNYQEAIDLFSEIPEDSFYSNNAKLKTEEAKRKIVEEELGETKIAKKEAEEKAQQEAIKRSQAEAKAKQEEFEKKLKEQQLSEKEAEERRMNADNDSDGLTYREELAKGTSDWNTDSDGDGIKDGEDAHPAGGGRYLAQNFEWEYEGTVWTWNYSIQEDWYEYYKNKPRSPHGTEYVTANDSFIKEIAKALRETADKENYHLTSFIVSFVQGLPYVEDYYTTFDEYPKYPIETFVERNGDCEDTSYLFASLAQATGRAGASLVEFHNHMGVGIMTGHSQSGYYYPIGDEWYYYYETTGEGWRVGDLPKDYLYENAKITRIWDGSVHYAYPKYIKPCYAIPDFPGYYSDGKNFYSDSQCNYLTYCVPYKEFYVNPQTLDFYWDSGCNQIVVKGCYKSKTYTGYFYKSGDAWYYNSECTQMYMSMSCDYPSSLGYTCTYEYEYTWKKSDCDYYKSSTYFQHLSEGCDEKLAQCRRDIDEYQSKLNEYNQCKARKEY